MGFFYVMKLLVLLFAINCLLSCINGVAQTKSENNDFFTGTYKLVSKYKSDLGEIEIKQIDTYLIKFYLNVTRTHYGYVARTYGKFHINNGIGIFHNLKYGADNCKLTFHFKSDTLFLNQEGTNTDCRFGLNAGVEGKYLKVSSKEPLFKELEMEKKARRKAKEENKISHQKIMIIRSKYLWDTVKLKTDSNKYNNFLLDSFRDSTRLMKLAGDLLHYRKLKRDTIFKCMQTLLNNNEFQGFPKHWISLSIGDAGYFLSYSKDNLNPSIEITDSVIIINEPNYTRGRYIKRFDKINDSLYTFSCFGDQFIGPDTCTFKILNPKTKFSIITYIRHLDSRKVFRWYMVPIAKMLHYPIVSHLIDNPQKSVEY